MRITQRVITLFTLGLLSQILHGQCIQTPNGDMEDVIVPISTPGIMDDNLWLNENLSDWSVSHGSPHLLFDGSNKMIELESTSGTTGDGVYITKALAVSLGYVITYDVLFTGANDDFKNLSVVLTNDLVPNDDITSDVIPTIPTSQVINEKSWNTTGTWITVTEFFMADDEYNQIWFYPNREAGSLPGSAICQIDNVCIERFTGSAGDCVYTTNGDVETTTATVTAPGVSGDNVWMNNNLTNWSVAHGSPDLWYNGINKSIQLFGFDETGGEGIYITQPLAELVPYVLTYEVYLTGPSSDFKNIMVELSNDLTPNNDISDFTFPSLTTNQLIHEGDWDVTGGWVTVTQNFIPLEAYDQILFYPLRRDGADASLAICRIDNVCIERLTIPDSECRNTNGDFELFLAPLDEPGITGNPFSDAINDFMLNWHSAHGSPDIRYDGSNTSIYLWSSGFPTTDRRSEGVFTNYNFVAGTTYELTYDILREGLGAIDDYGQFMVRLGNDLIEDTEPNDDYLPVGTGGAFTPISDNLFDGTQLVSELSWTTTDSWVTITEIFTPDENFNALWFHPFVQESVVGLAQCELDNVCIKILEQEDACDFYPNFKSTNGKCSYHFENMTTLPSEEYTILSTSWDFGDGTTAEGENVSHFYTEPGVYSLRMTMWVVNGQECCQKTLCKSIKVNATCSPCQVINFVTFDSEHEGTGTSTFSANIPTHLESLLGFYWDFGDGTHGAGVSVEHTYSTSGVYDVCLVVFYADPVTGECCSKRYCSEVLIDVAGFARSFTQNSSDSKQMDSKRTPQSDILIYPNPNNGTFILQSKGMFSHVKVFDATGKLIYSRAQSSNRLEIDLTTVDKGVYVLTALDEISGVLITRKVIIQ